MWFGLLEDPEVRIPGLTFVVGPTGEDPVRLRQVAVHRDWKVRMTFCVRLLVVPRTNVNT